MSKTSKPVTKVTKKVAPNLRPSPVLKLKPPPEGKKIGPPDLANMVVSQGKDKPSVSELAVMYEISRPTLYRYQADGVDIWNPAAVKVHLDRQYVKPDSYRELGGERTIEGAKLRKLTLEGERIQRQLDRDDGLEIPRGLIHDDAFSAGAQIRTAVMGLESELPPILVGLTESEMQKKLRPVLYKILEELVDPLSKRYVGKGR